MRKVAGHVAKNAKFATTGKFLVALRSGLFFVVFRGEIKKVATADFGRVF